MYYFEDSGEWPYRLDGAEVPRSRVALDARHNIEYLDRTLARFGYGDKWAYRLAVDRRRYGLSGPRRREVLGTADLLLNVSGSLTQPEHFRQVPRLAYIDTDPTFTQIRLQLERGFRKLQRRVAAHDVHFSFGERVGRGADPGSYDWIPTRQPVALDQWATDSPPGDTFTTVMSWTSFKPLAAGGQVFGQKDLEFQHYLDLPQHVKPVELEVAFSGTEHQNWQSERATSRHDLLLHGWRTVEANEVCGDLDSYRHYIQMSMAEWSVAKNGYVVGQPGWFSDRSACYLAAGRPVVVRDTGFGDVLPVGEGLLSFRTPEEAAAAVLEVQSHYPRHARAAREIAHEFFDAASVLTSLLERVCTPRS